MDRADCQGCKLVKICRIVNLAYSAGLDQSLFEFMRDNGALEAAVVSGSAWRKLVISDGLAHTCRQYDPPTED